MTWLSGAVRRIGSLDAISWPVFWITLVAGVIGNLITTTAAPVAVRLGTLAMGQAALWAPLLLARIRLRREPDRSRPGVVAVAALAGLMLRALTIGWMAAVLIGDQEVRWSQRFVGALLNVGLAFVVSAFVVSSLRERRRQIGQLSALEAALATSVAELSREYAERNDETLAKVQAVLLAELSGLDSADAGRSLEVLQRTAADVVRPLSHQLAQERPTSEGDLPTLSPDVSWRDVLDAAASGRPFRPVLTAVFVGIESIAATVAYPRGVGVYAGMVVAVVLLLALANGALSIALPGRSRATRMGLTVTAALLVGLIAGAFIGMGLGPVPAAPALVLGACFFTVAFSLGISVASAFGRDRARIVRALQESSQNLERRVVQLRQAQWFQHKALSRALHGPIQTAVTAAALRLDAAIRSGDVDPALVEQVRHELAVALGGLEAVEPRVASLAEAAERITATWEGLCAVSLAAQAGVSDVLEADPALRSCVIDILTEAVSNAVRHGAATWARIDLVRAGGVPGDVVVTITSDSAADRQDGRRGLGARILDDCTLEWRLDHADAGMRLVARLPAEVAGQTGREGMALDEGPAPCALAPGVGRPFRHTLSAGIGDGDAHGADRGRPRS